MKDNKNVSFENLKQLAILYNSGEVVKITQTIRNSKLEMETYCRDARAKQKEMLLISSVETKPNEDNTSKTVEEKKIVEPIKQTNNERIVNRQPDYNKNSFNKSKQNNNSPNSSNYSNSRTNQYNQQNQNRPFQSRFNNQKDKQNYNSNNKFSNQFNKDKKQLNSNKPNFLAKSVQKPKFEMPKRWKPAFSYSAPKALTNSGSLKVLSISSIVAKAKGKSKIAALGTKFA